MLDKIEAVLKKHGVEQVRISTLTNKIDVRVKGTITDELREDLQEILVTDHGMALTLSPMFSGTSFDEVENWKTVRLNDPAWRKAAGLEEK